jgi:hypothetical protein
MRGALHAEWTKQRTLPGTIWLLAATAVLTIAVSAAAAAAARCPPGTACPVDSAKLSLTGIEFGQAVVAILAAPATNLHSLPISPWAGLGVLAAWAAAALLAGGLLLRFRDT